MLLILIAVVIVPALLMPVTAPIATVLLRLLMILLLIFSVANAPVLEIPVKAPVPVLDKEMRLLLFRFTVPAPPEFTIPLNKEAAVPNVEQF